MQLRRDLAVAPSGDHQPEDLHLPVGERRAQDTVGAIPKVITDVFPDQPIIDRTFINAWEDPEFRDAVLSTGRRQIVMAGLWTEMCLAFPVISARQEGLDVYFVPDASGGQAHQLAVQRMIQAGAIPVDALTVLGKFQRDWSRQATYAGASAIAIEHGGAWGIGTTYVYDLTGAGKEKARATEAEEALVTA